MNRTTLLILFSILCAFIVITIGVFLWYELRERSEVSLLEDIRERTDIIVSDRVSLGCFIPPDINESEFNYIKNKLKSENKTLFDYCFSFKKSSVKWEDIANSLPYGIKLNGYCYDCSRKGCLCLNEDVPGFEGINTERRSLDFGTSYISGQIGKGFKKQSFAEIRGQPSVFVVKKGEEAKLSIYGGIFLTGQKSVEKVTATLYNGTVNESNRISTIAGEERSCYIGNNWNCYHSCRSSNSKDYCRVKCDCYTNQRYYDENSLDICKNYCNSKDFNGNSGDCKIGCEEGEKMNCYRDCFIKTGNAAECSGECSCYYCENIDKSDLINYFFCDEKFSNNKDKKHGCEKFLEIENSSFKIKSGEYTIFKIGDLSLTNPRYRGLAWAVANITTKEPHPGTSCYNPNNYDCYSQCCDEVCEYADICCGDFNTKCKDKKKTIHIPGLTPVTVTLPKCEKRCNCSTTTRTETENPFVLCKIFCSSRDGYYGNNTKIMKCQEGCDWGARVKGKEEYYVGSGEEIDTSYYEGTNNLEVYDKIILDGVHEYDNVHIHSGGVITTSIGKKLILKAKAIIIDPGGKIDVSGKGDNSAGKGEDGQSSGIGDMGKYASGGSGGGYGSTGGKGGDDVYNGPLGGNSHGSEEDPQDLGSPGGDGGGASSGGGYGGLGGGAVIIKAKKLVLNGEILANGHDGCDGGNTNCGGGIIYKGKSYCNQSSSCHSSACSWRTGVPNSDGTGGGGGGSGGTVNIDVKLFLFNGKIEAKGGNGGNDINNLGWDGSGGGGSGGRVKIMYEYRQGNGIINLSGGQPGCAKEERLTGATGGENEGTLKIKVDEIFETGYDKFVNLTKNTISVDKPYVWKNVYDEVWSNLIYIVNWDFSSADWSYPCGGNWEKICTPKFNKPFELNSAIMEIKKFI